MFNFPSRTHTNSVFQTCCSNHKTRLWKLSECEGGGEDSETEPIANNKNNQEQHVCRINSRQTSEKQTIS